MASRPNRLCYLLEPLPSLASSKMSLCGPRYGNPYLALPSAVVQPAARGKSTYMESERCKRKEEPRNGHFGRSSAA